jgi:exopolysaccharide production protein ExoY
MGAEPKLQCEHQFEADIVQAIGAAAWTWNERAASDRTADLRVGSLGHFWSRCAKRSFDVIVASVLVVVCAPLFLVITIILLSDGGPPFFSQERVGRGGRRFGCYKFRTMVVDAEDRLARLLAEDPAARAEWNATQKLKNDPRVTGWGRWLRRTSIDELPQLLNVIAGHMSLVGPRPIPTPELAQYGPEISVYIRERPGITGLWQVSGRNDLDYRARVALNSRYVMHRTFYGDVKILGKTALIVLGCRGAY